MDGYMFLQFQENVIYIDHPMITYSVNLKKKLPTFITDDIEELFLNKYL